MRHSLHTRHAHGVHITTSALMALLIAAGAAQAQPAAPTPAAAKRPPAAAKPTAPKPADGYTVEPAPAWVETVPVDTAQVAQLPRAPVHILLDDMQTRVEAGGGQAHFVHVVRQVNESGGLESASQVQIEFDPSYESLALHTLAIWRNGSRIDKLPTRKLTLLHRESQLERQMVDGRRTASIVLDDVRVGDRVEFAYTLKGANPVFEGKFVANEWTLNQRGPTALVRYRLLAPSGRDIRLRADKALHEVSTREQAGWRETLVRRVQAPQFQHDPYAPASVYLPDQIQLSEFADWGEVARWGARVFAAAQQAPSAAVQAQAEQLRRAAGDQVAERVRRTLDFVQTEVRYFGTEIGANSHRPAEPDAVLKQRFGDCKDKTTLLAALLKAQGINSTPVLVSTYLRSDVAGMLPSPLAFNHVVARVDMDGGLLLDGTRGRQTGPLAERESRGLGFGLPTDASTQALSPLPDSRRVLHVEGEDRVVFSRLSTDPVLEAQLTYHGEFAENIRYMLDAQPLPEVEKRFVSEYARHYPGAEVTTPLQVEEVAGRNALRVRLGLKLPNYLRLPEAKQLAGEFGLPAVITELRLPDQAPRKLPMRLGNLGIYRHAVEFKFPEEVYTRDERTPFDHVGNHFELHTLVDGKRDSARFAAELVLLKEKLEPADWPGHRDLLLKLWPRIAGNVTVPTLSQRQATALLDRLKGADEEVKRGQARLKTEAQQSAQAKLWVLQARLDSGRLPPRPRSQILAERGVQQDHLGRPAEAALSFKEALQLDPQNSAAHAGLSVNALLRGEDELSVSHASQALQLAPGESGPRYTRAYAHYYAGRIDAARDELLDILRSRSEVDRSYATLWLHIATRKLGGDAVGATRPYQPLASSSDSQPAWPYPVVKLLNGNGTLDEALAAARADKQAAEGRLCELYFFLGQQQLLNGQAGAARESFQKAVNTGVVEYTEYALAQRELQQLAKR